mgnify:CR=1 FL=1|tara:strand:+ start:1855 stop:3036 length:1182 start_codon:yes stop_codon:yes gene_type:complete
MDNFTTTLATVPASIAFYNTDAIFHTSEDNGTFGLADTQLIDCYHADLLTYMLRRFGLPNVTSDDYKENGAWLITTPLDNVVVRICPSPTGARFSIIPHLVLEEVPLETVQVDKESLEKYKAAFKIAVNDLLTPVAIRGHYFNAMGDAEHCIVVEDDEITNLADSSDVLAHPDPERFYGSDAHQSFLDLAMIHNKPLAEGIAENISILQNYASSILHAEHTRVTELVFSNFVLRDNLADFEISKQMPINTQKRSVYAAIHNSIFGDSNDIDVTKYKEGDILLASRYVNALGGMPQFYYFLRKKVIESAGDKMFGHLNDIMKSYSEPKDFYSTIPEVADVSTFDAAKFEETWSYTAKDDHPQIVNWFKKFNDFAFSCDVKRLVLDHLVISLKQT